jgi:hypothetical protein
MVQKSASNNTMAMMSIGSAAAAWIVGGLGSCLLVLFFFPLSFCTGAIFLGGNVIAVITGFMARNEIRDSGGTEKGAELATVGLIAGVLGALISLLLFCLGILSFLGLLAVAPEIGDIFSDIVRELETPVP